MKHDSSFCSWRYGGRLPIRTWRYGAGLPIRHMAIWHRIGHSAHGDMAPDWSFAHGDMAYTAYSAHGDVAADCLFAHGDMAYTAYSHMEIWHRIAHSHMAIWRWIAYSAHGDMAADCLLVPGAFQWLPGAKSALEPSEPCKASKIISVS